MPLTKIFSNLEQHPNICDVWALGPNLFHSKTHIGPVSSWLFRRNQHLIHGGIRIDAQLEMMSTSIHVQPRVEGGFTNRPSFPFMNVSCVRSKSSFCVAGKQPSVPKPYRNLKFKALERFRRLPRAAELAPAETMEDVLDAKYGEEEPEVAKVVKPMVKPRVVLKFIWMEKNIGLGLDQMIPGHGTVPLSPYFFWPRKDAWEELKTTLEAKPWISQKNMIILLNQATDIINLWQQSGGNLS